MHLARALPDPGRLTVESGWSARHLAMMSHALAKIESLEIQYALTRLAQAFLTRRELTVATGWSAQPLGMLAWGLARGEGSAIREALTRLAQVVPQGPRPWQRRHGRCPSWP